MTDNATPRPWTRPTRYFIKGEATVTRFKDGFIILELFGTDLSESRTTANADIILQAVNSHDELVAASEALLADYDMSDSDDWCQESSTTKLFNRLGSVLTKAKGEA